MVMSGSRCMYSVYQMRSSSDSISSSSRLIRARTASSSSHRGGLVVVLTFVPLVVTVYKGENSYEQSRARSLAQDGEQTVHRPDAQLSWTCGKRQVPWALVARHRCRPRPVLASATARRSTG